MMMTPPEHDDDAADDGDYDDADAILPEIPHLTEIGL